MDKTYTDKNEINYFELKKISVDPVSWPPSFDRG